MKKKIYLIVIAVVLGLYFISPLSPIVVINKSVHFVFEENLKLTNTDVKNDDVKSIYKLKRLKNIRLDVTSVTDMRFLSNMHALEDLYFCGHPDYYVEDWTPLLDCESLETFCGMRMNIEDLSVFKNMNNLKELYLEYDYALDIVVDSKVKVSDISDVKYLVNLEIFYLEGENITDISALRYCPNLKSVKLNGINAKDCSVFLELPELKYLEIDKGVLSNDLKEKLIVKGVEVKEYDY